MTTYDKVNESAMFDPQFETPDGEEWDGSRPCLTVAGVQVYAYIREDGELRVSLDFDTADPAVFGEDSDGYADNVPVQLIVGGEMVYRIDRNGTQYHGRDAGSYDDGPLS